MHATPRSFVRGQRRCTQIRQFGPFSALTLEASWIILQSGQICGDNGPVVWAPSLRSTSSKAPDLRKLLCEMVGRFAELLIFSPKKVSRYGHTAENSSS